MTLFYKGLYHHGNMRLWPAKSSYTVSQHRPQERYVAKQLQMSNKMI
jgi:hypothetical protein